LGFVEAGTSQEGTVRSKNQPNKQALPVKVPSFKKACAKFVSTGEKNQPAMHKVDFDKLISLLC
jgi:hypothetical protein